MSFFYPFSFFFLANGSPHFSFSLGVPPRVRPLLSHGPEVTKQWVVGTWWPNGKNLTPQHEGGS